MASITSYVSSRGRFSSYDSLHHIPRLEGICGKIKGWFLSLFDSAFQVYDEARNKYFYLRTADVVRHLNTTSSPAAQKIPLTSKKITCLVLENLNPVTGKTPTIEKVSRFFREFRTPTFIQRIKDAQDPKRRAELIEGRLENFKERHLTIIPFDHSDIITRLKPGDIFFKKIPEKEHNIVVTGQSFFSPFLKRKERQGYHFSHVAIYIGNGKIAEAVPANHGSQVRILDIRDSHFALTPSSQTQYLISRFKNEPLAFRAAEIAAWIAKDDTKGNSHFPSFKYNKFEAIRSIFHSSRFGLFARYRYLKQYIDARYHDIPSNIFGYKTFFCTYFTGYCFQLAEAQQLIPSLFGKYDVSFKQANHYRYPLFRELWARVRRCQFWKAMSKNITLQFDSKRITPHNWRNFMLAHPHLVQDLYLIKSSA